MVPNFDDVNEKLKYAYKYLLRLAAYQKIKISNVYDYMALADFMGDKAGARLDYGNKFVFTDGSTLESNTPDYEITNMYQNESRGFIDSINNGTPNRSDIERVLETAKLLEALYKSAELKKEITF